MSMRSGESCAGSWRLRFPETGKSRTLLSVTFHTDAGERPDHESVLRRRAFALQKRNGAKLDRTSLSTDVFVRAP